MEGGEWFNDLSERKSFGSAPAGAPSASAVVGGGVLADVLWGLLDAAAALGCTSILSQLRVPSLVVVAVCALALYLAREGARDGALRKSTARYLIALAACVGLLHVWLNVFAQPTSWRDDMRCGPDFEAPNGGHAECDPWSDQPCCSAFGWCGAGADYCDCKTCRSYAAAGGIVPVNHPSLMQLLPFVAVPMATVFGRRFGMLATLLPLGSSAFSRRTVPV